MGGWVRQVGVWDFRRSLDELQQSILSAVEARRRLSGLDDLMTYFKDEVTLRHAQTIPWPHDPGDSPAGLCDPGAWGGGGR
jgi:hypothetical protein